MIIHSRACAHVRTRTHTHTNTHTFAIVLRYRCWYRRSGPMGWHPYRFAVHTHRVCLQHRQSHRLVLTGPDTSRYTVSQTSTITPTGSYRDRYKPLCGESNIDNHTDWFLPGPIQAAMRWVKHRQSHRLVLTGPDTSRYTVSQTSTITPTGSYRDRYKPLCGESNIDNHTDWFLPGPIQAAIRWVKLRQSHRLVPTGPDTSRYTVSQTSTITPTSSYRARYKPLYIETNIIT
jgi:hypothetical protein